MTIGNLNFGLLLSFFDHSICIRDAAQSLDFSFNNQKLEFMPMIYDIADPNNKESSVLQGFLSYIAILLNGIQYPDRVSIPMDNDIRLAREIGSFFELIFGFFYFHEILAKSTDFQTKSWNERLSLSVIQKVKQQRFLYSLTIGSGFVVRFALHGK